MRRQPARSGAASLARDPWLWAALVPLLLLMRPYEGLIQDARIYIGSALADRDPLGVGRDLMFAADGQTDFTVLKPLIRTLLGVMAPTDLSLVLALAGGFVWLAAVVLLCRRLAPGRVGWAAALCILALPPDYGAYGTFVYGETILTPRVFAEAAVIAGLAELLDGRRIVAIALMAAAAALHPLMALAGIATAAAMLAWEDRRWLWPIGGALLALVGAAALKLPVAGRLFEPMDPEWLAILKGRSVNLFPSLWDAGAFAHTAGRAAAVAVAATLVPPRQRALLLAALGVALGGLALTAVFGDGVPLVLVTQLQTWRALWLLALLGNAALALAAVALWQRGPAARLTLAALLLAWLAASTVWLSIALSAAAVGLRLADGRGTLSALSPRIGRIALALALGAAAVDTVLGGLALLAYLRASWAQGAEPVYSLMLAPGVHRWPLAIGAVVLALRGMSGAPEGRAAKPFARSAKAAAGLGLATAAVAGALLWNSGSSEGRLIDAAQGSSAELKRLIGPLPGSVLWVDDYNQSWFLADRPAYFNSTQGCPILFSRGLALTWLARGKTLVGEGMARQSNLTPWAAAGDDAEDLPVPRASVEAVCRAPDHPVAIVAPGRHLDSAPPGWSTGLWTPPAPVHFLSGGKGGLRWRRVETFTVIQCGAADTQKPPA